MKKRILSLVLAFVVATSCFSFGVAAKENNYSEDIFMLKSMNLLTNQQIKLKIEDEITRAEFAKLVVKLLNLDMKIDSSKESFTDLKEGDNGYSEVMTLVSLKIMAGYQDNTFKPNNKILMVEAVKIYVHLLGYKYKALAYGGYPMGYIRCATDINLTKGIAYNERKVATWGEIAKLSNNALDIPLVIETGVGSDSTHTIDKNVTILTKYLKMERKEGTVTANHLASVKGNPLAQQDHITIDNVNYKPSNYDQMNLIGRKVTYVYKIDDNTTNKEIVCMVKDEKNTSISFTKDEYLRMNENEVYYSLNETSEKKITLSQTVDIIYNGENGVYSKDMFQNVVMGNFEFVMEGSICQLIIINDYKTMVVGKIDKNNKIITDDTNPALTLNLNKNEKKVIIKDTSHNEINFDFISTLDLLTYVDNKNYCEVYVSQETKSGEIKEVIRDNETKLLIGDETLTLNSYATIAYSAIKSGDIVKCVMDRFGKVGYISILNKTGYEYVYMVKLAGKSSGVEEKVFIKAYSTTSGLKVYTVNENVNFNGSLIKNVNVEKLNEAQQFNNNNEQLIGIKLNDDNKISHIITAMDAKDLDKTSNDNFCKTHPTINRRYVDDPPTLNRSIVLNSSTNIIRIPTNIDDAKDSDFATISLSYLSKGTDYRTEAYNSSKDYQIPEFIIVRLNLSGGGSAPAIKDEDPLAVVKDRVKTITQDGAEVERINVISGGEETFFYVEEDNKPQFEIKPGVFVSCDDLQKGDIIRYSNDAQGYIRALQVYSDYSEDEWYASTDIERYGFIKTTIEKKMGNYISVYHWNTKIPEELYGMFDITEKTGTIGGVAVIETRNSGEPFIRVGSYAEIEKGDKVIIHMAYAQLIGIIILR